jgi:hypothetical protein
MKLLYLTAAAVNAYVVNKCRDFSDKLVPDFSLDDFSGEWYPIYRSKDSMRVQGQCPIWHFERYEPTTEYQA